jgi:hypothetical protein
MNKTSKRLMAIGLPLAGIAATGVAFAAWTSTGAGSGTATAKSAVALVTATATAPASADLYPGATGGALVVRFSNPNPYPVVITSISQDSSSFVSSDKGTACTDAAASTHPTGVSFAGATNPIGGAVTDWTVPAKGATNGEAEYTVAANVAMSNLSDNGCQGAVFSIPVTFSGQSNS